MIVFKKLKYRNLLSFGNNWTEIDFLGAQTTLIIGKNGQGKSSITSALVFGLFGKSDRGKKNQLINTINKKELEVIVEFTKNNNKEYIIRRGISPNIFEIYENGILINQDATTKDYQKFLENEILRLNYKTFHQTVILAASSFIPFMNLPAAGRREVIEDILDISIFSKMKVVHKEKLDQIKKELRNQESKIRFQKEKIQQYESYKNQFQEESDKRSKSLLDKISTLKEEKTLCKQKLAEKKLIWETASNETTKLKTKLNEEKAEIDNQEATIKVRIKEITRKIKFFESNNTCPTCSQEINIETKETTKQQEQEKIPVIKQQYDEIKSRQTKIANELKQLDEQLQELYTLHAETQNLNYKVSSLEENINELQQELNDIESNKSFKENNELYKDLIKLEESYNDNSNTQTYLLSIQEMLKDKGIKGVIIKKYLPIINNLLNKYLTILDFFVLFNFDENFDETVLARHRESFSYGSFSEGEKARLNLAILFTWRQIARIKNSTTSNLLFLDEVMDSSLDKEGSEKLIEILTSEGEQDNNIFIITHSDDIQQMEFGRKLLVKKEQNFSEITELVGE